ncbi:hypothetical protein SAMN05421847_2157 [Halpernia humi]|uniref:Uncharacterized protein n=1 Tax=Halpernia humi TaxID=493375 RepID=A0A1H5ZQH5_9FLAO|nr:hypothetical protein [Halpernia humi]SEG38803.1 hypothetical protein SAMN05421847_2157 [Halpernia humi]
MGVIGAMASMLITNAFVAGGSVVTGAPSTKPNKPNAKNKPSKARWRTAEPSRYFGRRSKIVTAETPKGPQKMKLKNALKKDFEFTF